MMSFNWQFEHRIQVWIVSTRLNSPSFLWRLLQLVQKPEARRLVTMKSHYKNPYISTGKLPVGSRN